MDVRKIFEKTVRKYKLIENGDRILVAVSGGKDSMAMYTLLNDYVKDMDVQLKAFHINLGFNFNIKDFVDATVFDLKREYGFYLHEARKLKRPICAICGTIKRYVLNKYARENGYNKIATGHTASDMTMFFFKNLMSGNMRYNSSLKPIAPSHHEKIVTRIKPMFFISDKQIKKFCIDNNIPFKRDPCPFAPKDKIKQIVSFADEFKEDFSYNVARYVATLDGERNLEFKECKICGEPTTQEICAFCKIRKQLGKI